MPQDSLRSVVYRSFVTCDDPKGVVEASTIRRSKSKGKDKDHRTKGSSSTSTSLDEERADSVPPQSTEELQSLSSFQISEVSRGAQKLNDAIDSWSSNTESFENHSNFIAKDLLKGALHLQESLVMLGKLQEASRLMAKRPKKKHKERVEGAEFMFQKSGVSADQSSKDCYDELREVIRESFARQNLLPKASAADEKDIVVHRRSLDLGADFSSTSSSHSSRIPEHSSHCSPSNAVQREKPKGPNLIAKLMGLEEVPRKASSSVVYKQFPKGKLSNQRSYLVDIDLVRPKKPQFVVQKGVRERRSLEEMIETMQFKGLLGRNIDGSDHGMEFSDVCLSRNCSALEDPPIVIMKPRQVPEEKIHANYGVNEEKTISSRQMPRKRVEAFPLGAFDVLRAQLKFTETNDKLRAGITPKSRINSNEARVSEESPARLVKKTLDSQNSPSSMKINHRKTSPTKVQKKEVVKKIDTEMKVDSNKRKQVVMNDDKTQEATKTQDLQKATTLKLGKPARESNIAKVHVAQGEKTTMEKNMKPKSPKPCILKKKLQKSKPNSKTSVGSMQSDDNFWVNFESATTSEKIIEEVPSVSCGPIPHISEDASSYYCESSGPTIKDDVEHIENGSPIPHPGADEIKGSKSTTNTQYLLFSSKSFLNHAKELFNTGPCDPTDLPTTLLPGGEMHDASILLKCAEEILERKSQPFTTNLLSQNLIQPKCYLSLEKLLGEISDEIDELRNYSKSTGDLISERIYSMLRRDLSTKAGLIGNWDLGWRNCFTVDHVNGVANDVEDLVLGEILEDAITQLMF